LIRRSGKLGEHRQHLVGVVDQALLDRGLVELTDLR